MNQLYYGDNLEILRKYIPDKSIDLIYIDPPFNSNQAYNAFFPEVNGSLSQAQIQAFDDTWHWNEATQEAYDDLIQTAPPQLVEAVKSFRSFLGEMDLMAYLVNMAIRLVELHQVLKPTGSFYLHCDPTASHYLKIVLDQIFGIKNFRTDIVWQRTSAHGDSQRWGNINDNLLFFTKTDQYIWNPQKRPFTPEYIKSHYSMIDKETGKRFSSSSLTAAGKTKSGETGQPWRGFDPNTIGRHWSKPPSQLDELDKLGRIYWPPKKGGWPREKLFLDERNGRAVPNIWEDIPPINSQAKERLGYPTQKPEALLERVIKASSNEGDTVLDAFAGCGTTIAVAQRLNRRWIGIDITHLAIALLKYRLQGAFGDDVKYEIIGEPKDEASARALANQDRYQFQWWALSLISARPYQGQKKGADEGVDGVIYFKDVDHKTNKSITQKIVVQVKSGNVGLKDIKELRTTVENQNAVIGVFITLDSPTKPMITEAVKGGSYQRFQMKYPKIQIRTIAELLSGKRIEYPQTVIDATFKKAERATQKDEQLELL